MSALIFESDIDTDKLHRKVSQIDSELHSLALKAANSGSMLDKSFKQAGMSADDFHKKTINAGNAMASIGALVSLSLIANFAKEIANVRGEWQKYEAVLTNTLGSNQDAVESLDMIAKYGAKTNFQVNELTDSFVKLASQGFKPTRDELASLGDLAAYKAKGFNQLTEALIDAETFEFERLKEFGIRAAKNGDEIQFTFKGVKTTVDASAESVRNYILSLGQLDGVKGSTEAISKTIVGLASNFEDAWSQMLNSIGKDQEGLIAGSIVAATSMVNNYEKVVDVIKVLIATYGTYKAASIALAVVETYRAEMMVTKTVQGMYQAVKVTQQLTFAQWGAAKAQGALNAAMSVNPWVASFTIISAIIGSLLLFTNSADEAADAQKRVNDTVNEQRSKIETLVTIIKSETSANGDRAKALKELNDLLPDSIGYIDAQTLSTKKGKDAIDEYIRSIRKKAEVESLTNQLNKNISDQEKVSGGDMTGQLNFVQRVAYSGLTPEEKEADQARAMYNLKEQEAQIKKNIELVVSGGKTEENAGKNTIRVADQIMNVKKQLIEAEIKLRELRSASSTATPEEIKKQSDLIDRLKEQQSVLTGIKEKVKEVSGAYDKIEEEIKKASDAVINASAKERPALQEKLSALVKQRQAWEDIIKAQRGETKGLKPLAVTAQITTSKEHITEQLKPMKQLTDEQKKQLEAKSKQLDIDEASKENYKQQIDLIQQSVSFLDETIKKYGEMLGLSEDQQKALENGMNAMKGMAQIASGNVIQGAFTLVASLADTLISKPEKISEIFEGINQNIQKVIKSIDIASESLGNMNKDSSSSSMKILKSQLLDLADSAKSLNDELAKSSTGRRRDVNMSLPNIVKQAADINVEIEKLTNRLLQGDISDEQRKAIEAILDGYNALLAKIDSTIQDITGTTVTDLSRSISDAILNGADAWDVWGQKANDVIRNVISKQLSAKLLNAPITDAVNALVNDSMNGLTADESKKFQDAIKSIYESVVPIYEATKNSLSGVGIDIGSAQANASTPLTGISAQMTEETGSLVAGQFMAMRVDLKTIQETGFNSLEYMDNMLSALNNIDRNTKHNVRLNDIADSVNETNRILKEKL